MIDRNTLINSWLNFLARWQGRALQSGHRRLNKRWKVPICGGGKTPCFRHAAHKIQHLGPWVPRVPWPTQSVTHEHRTGPLEAIQINEAKLEIIRAVQKKAFPNELKKEEHMWLQESSKIQGLCSCYDKEGRVIRLRPRNQLPKWEAVDLILVNISTGC